jgi:hypothetical protein
MRLMKNVSVSHLGAGLRRAVILMSIIRLSRTTRTMFLKKTVQFGLGHDRNPRDQQITSALPLRGEIGQLGLNRPGLVR